MVLPSYNDLVTPKNPEHGLLESRYPGARRIRLPPFEAYLGTEPPKSELFDVPLKVIDHAFNPSHLQDHRQNFVDFYYFLNEELCWTRSGGKICDQLKTFKRDRSIYEKGLECMLRPIPLKSRKGFFLSFIQIEEQA